MFSGRRRAVFIPIPDESCSLEKSSRSSSSARLIARWSGPDSKRKRSAIVPLKKVRCTYVRKLRIARFIDDIRGHSRVILG